MNFIAHYIYEGELDNPLFTAALGIPDLTARFSYSYNKLIKHAAWPSEKKHRHIHQGILRHYAADKKFHASPHFSQLVSNFIRHATHAGIDRGSIRASVIAHIAVEMMLDRFILMQNPAVVYDYYKLLDNADTESLEGYFLHLNMSLEKQDFITKFQFHKKNRFLLMFNELDKIAMGIGRIYASATKSTLSETEQKQLIAALYNIENDMRYSWQNLLKV